MHARRIRHVGPMVLQGVSWSDAAELLPSRYARAVRGADGLGQGKPYWTTRLRAVTVPFRMVLRNGMLPPVPVVTARIDRVVPSPWGKKRSGTYALHIGRVMTAQCICYA